MESFSVLTVNAQITAQPRFELVPLLRLKICNKHPPSNKRPPFELVPPSRLRKFIKRPVNRAFTVSLLQATTVLQSQKPYFSGNNSTEFF